MPKSGAATLYGAASFIGSHTAPAAWSGPDSPYTFVREGIAHAIAQANAAGEKNIAVAAARIAQQCLQLGLLDEIQIHLAYALLAEDIRLFDTLSATPMQLERTQRLEALDVTHL